jgi:lipoprotein-anchoring transpeptidase ErfK/SrfK
MHPRTARALLLRRTHAMATAIALASACAAIAGCRRDAAEGSASSAAASASAAPAAVGAAAPPASQGLSSVAAKAPEGRPMLGVTAFSTIVYAEPRDTAKRLGYLRLGAKVPRSDEVVSTKGCPAAKDGGGKKPGGGWYEIFPRGFVCAGDEATIDMESPVLRAASRRPDLAAPMPYRYGFVRAVLPLYLKVPTKDEQLKSEFKLEEHLAWYEQNKADVDRVKLGAWDVPLDDRGVPVKGKRLGELGTGKNSLEVGLGVLFGGQGEDDPAPFWLEGNGRSIPNVSDFAVPEYAVFADRARRFTGLGLIGSFVGGEEAMKRRFAITTDLRLAPTTKLKPDTGSPFHGVELGGELSLPLAFVREEGATAWALAEGGPTSDGDAAYRSVIPLSGKQKKVAGERYVQGKDGRWFRTADLGLVLPPRTFPRVADKGEKWVEVSLSQQTLTLWEGHQPVYATLVSTGRKEYPTLVGEFRIQNKHITATMDSDESSSVGGVSTSRTVASRPEAEGPRGGGEKKAAPKPAEKPAAAKPKDKGKGKENEKKDGKAKAAAKPADKEKSKPAVASGAEPIIPRRGDGEYGVTKRRGEGTYQLRDVPYIQYFAAGQALHAAYWHDVFGKPRSHGCVNLSPIDAHRVFMWTEPAIPDGWHGLNTGDENGVGTTVILHE